MRQIISPLDGIRSPFGARYGFSPAALFALAEPGVWYDPSDTVPLNWRRNLLTFTEQFDNVVWTKTASTVTANAAVAPDGTTTADKLVEAATTGAHFVANAATTYGAATYTFSAYVKAAERNWVLLIGLGGNNFNCYFDLSGTGSVGTAATGTIGAIAAVGNGWFRCSVTKTFTATTASGSTTISTATADGVNSYAGDGTSGILIWGAQLEVGSTTTAYQRITDVNTEALALYPNTTLFQDAAGTTPVTAVEQSVGLVLDKSKGLVLGSERVVNGTFDSGITGWAANANATLSYTGSAIRATRTTDNDFGINQTISGLTSGRYYAISVQQVGGTATGFYINIDTFGNWPALAQRTGTFSGVFQATSSSFALSLRAFGAYSAGATIDFDNISVKELPGNHATQSTAASRPVLSARYNAFVPSQPTTGTGVTVSTSAVAAPDGTLATRITKSDATTPRYVFLTTGSTTIAASTSYTARAFVRYDGFDTTVSLEYNQTGNWGGVGWIAPFNVTATGVTAATPASCTSSATDVGGGWYLISAFFTTGASVTIPSNPSVLARITGASGVSVLYCNADLRVANDGMNLPVYQRVNTSTDYDTVGFPPYLRFDGSDDFLVTNTITPGIDKAQVFAGVRKLGAGEAILTEFSSTFSSTDAFGITLPSNSGDATSKTYWRGAVAALTLTVPTSPSTGVLHSQINNSASSGSSRWNQGTYATATGTTSGNFLAYPLYIGRRFGNPPTVPSSLPFNGRLYSLIVRFGANLTADQITQTETWVNGKTKGY